MEDAAKYLAELRKMSFTVDVLVQKLSEGDLSGNLQSPVTLKSYYTANYHVNLVKDRLQESAASTNPGRRMSMEQINKYRSPIVLGVLVLFLLLFAFFLLGFQPTTSKITEQESEMSQLEQQNRLIENKIQEFNTSTADNGAQDELLAKLPTRRQ